MRTVKPSVISSMRFGIQHKKSRTSFFKVRDFFVCWYLRFFLPTGNIPLRDNIEFGKTQKQFFQLPVIELYFGFPVIAYAFQLDNLSVPETGMRYTATDLQV